MPQVEHREPVRVDGFDDVLVTGVGFLSIGIGLAELVLAPRVASAIGAAGQVAFVRLFGVRSLVSGVGILATRRPGWLWSRVVGDAVVLALLAAASESTRPRNAAPLTAAVVAMTALDVAASTRVARKVRETRGVTRRPVD
jgi:hypothetical protein